MDNADLHAFKLLPLATRFQLPGLQSLCERTLLESLTPNSVPGVLLLADECDCENLRKAALNYCESSKEIKDCVQTGEKSYWTFNNQTYHTECKYSVFCSLQNEQIFKNNVFVFKTQHSPLFILKILFYLDNTPKNWYSLLFIHKNLKKYLNYTLFHPEPTNQLISAAI